MFHKWVPKKCLFFCHKFCGYRIFNDNIFETTKCSQLIMLNKAFPTLPKHPTLAAVLGLGTLSNTIQLSTVTPNYCRGNFKQSNTKRQADGTTGWERENMKKTITESLRRFLTLPKQCGKLHATIWSCWADELHVWISQHPHRNQNTPKLSFKQYWI